MKDFEARTEFVVGERAHLERVTSEHDVIAFAKIAGDHNPLHTNEESARRTRFKSRVVQRMFSASLVSAVLGTKLPGPGSIYLNQKLKFVRALCIGDSLTAGAGVNAWYVAKRILRDGNKVSLVIV